MLPERTEALVGSMLGTNDRVLERNHLATQIATSGASFGALASCAAGVASQIRTQEAPDVGTVQVAVVLRFRPS